MASGLLGQNRLERPVSDDDRKNASERPKSRTERDPRDIADVSILQASQLIELIRLRLAEIRAKGDTQSSALARECEAVLAEIRRELGAIGRE